MEEKVKEAEVRKTEVKEEKASFFKKIGDDLESINKLFFFLSFGATFAWGVINTGIFFYFHNKRIPVPFFSTARMEFAVIIFFLILLGLGFLSNYFFFKELVERKRKKEKESRCCFIFNMVCTIFITVSIIFGLVLLGVCSLGMSFSWIYLIIVFYASAFSFIPILYSNLNEKDGKSNPIVVGGITIAILIMLVFLLSHFLASKETEFNLIQTDDGKIYAVFEALNQESKFRGHESEIADGHLKIYSRRIKYFEGSEVNVKPTDVKSVSYDIRLFDLTDKIEEPKDNIAE